MYYVVTQNSTGDFVKEVVNGEPVYTTVEAEADWDASEAVVAGYIDRFNLTGVKVRPGQGLNHPPKPPISSLG